VAHLPDARSEAQDGYPEKDRHSDLYFESESPCVAPCPVKTLKTDTEVKPKKRKIFFLNRLTSKGAGSPPAPLPKNLKPVTLFET
jgi:hypothetical protein